MAFGFAVWVVTGNPAGVTNATGNFNESAISRTVADGSVVIYGLDDWNATNPPGKTPLTGSGTATERSDGGDGATHAHWLADWVGTTAGTYNFGPNNYTSLKVAQAIIEIRYGGTIVWSDDFNHAGETFTDANWARSAHDWQVANNRLELVTNNASNAYIKWDGETLSDEQYIEFDILNDTAPYARQVAIQSRDLTPFTGYKVALTAPGDIYVWRDDAYMGYTPSTWAYGDRFRLGRLGDTVYLALNGNIVFEHTDTSPLVGGAPIYWGNNDQSNLLIDNLSVGHFPASGEPTGTGTATDVRDTASGAAVAHPKATGAVTDVRDTATGAAVATVTSSGTPTDTVDAASGAGTASSGAPTVPQILVATAIGADSIGLTWDAFTGAVGYDIERDSVIIVIDHPTNSYTDTGLDPATEYTYRVRAELG